MTSGGVEGLFLGPSAYSRMSTLFEGIGALVIGTKILVVLQHDIDQFIWICKTYG